MSPKQHNIKTLVDSVARNFFAGHQKFYWFIWFIENEIKSRHQGANTIRCKSEIFPPTPYFYGADPANIENAVKNFAGDRRPKSIGMFFIILSTNKLAVKSKYSTWGLEYHAHYAWTNRLYRKRIFLRTTFIPSCCKCYYLQSVYTCT